MTAKERVLNRERQRGREAALSLAMKAEEMTGRELIEEESDIPAWNENAVYSSAHIGFPIRDGGQVYIILQAHTPAHNPGVRPADLPAIYSIQHTTDPDRAKPYMPPYGTSGLYSEGECCTYEGQTWRSLKNNNPYAPGVTGTADWWEVISDA